MKTIHDFFKLIHNPHRLRMLELIYESKDGGCNVGYLCDEFERLGLNASSVSTYLGDLEETAIIRRERAGKYVNYLADDRYAPARISEAWNCIRLMLDGKSVEERQSLYANMDRVFEVLMNPFRARVIVALKEDGSMSSAMICEKFLHQMKYLKRDLKIAVVNGLITADDSDVACANYSISSDIDAFTEKMMELCSDHTSRNVV